MDVKKRSVRNAFYFSIHMPLGEQGHETGVLGDYYV